MSKRNIAYLLGSVNRGGAETLILDYFQQKENLPFNPIGIYRNDGVLLPFFLNSGVKIYHCSPGFLFDISYLFRLRKLFSKEKVQIAHAQQPIDGLYACLASIGTPTRVFLTIHGYDHKLPPRARKYLWLALKWSNCILFVSNTQRDYYLEKIRFNLSKKSRVLYNGVSFNKLAKIKTSDIREELGVESKKLLFGSVGNFNAVRDQMTICRFLNLLNRQGVDFKFVFAGAQCEKEPWRLENCISYCKENNIDSKVHFLGSRNDVPNILSQLDAFVYSSSHDTFGIAAVEAIASGIPVFLNDWEVMNEISEDGTLANIYYTKNENDLLWRFMHFLDNQREFQEDAIKSSIKIKEKYSLETHIRTLNSFYIHSIEK